MYGSHWEQVTQEQSAQCEILRTPACPFTLQKEEKKKAEKEKKAEELEEVPTEEMAEVPRARRSSYAFSHQEGYANLITQGTIMRRSRMLNKYSSDEDRSTSIDFI